MAQLTIQAERVYSLKFDMDTSANTQNLETARGYSNEYDLGEAIKDAITKLPDRSNGISDFLASYTVLNIGAEIGGIAGFNRLYVDVQG
jgi:hypothetical protein